MQNTDMRHEETDTCFPGSGTAESRAAEAVSEAIIRAVDSARSAFGIVSRQDLKKM